MGSITIDPVITWRDVFFLRMARNACRKYMTNDQREIKSDYDQLQWFKSLDDSWDLYVVRLNGVNAGYGTARRAGPITWVTGGLLSEYRGHGLGRVLFQFFKDQYELPYLDVLATNTPAIMLYESLGWRTYDSRDGLYGSVLMMRIP